MSGVRVPEGALKGSDFVDLGLRGWDFFYAHDNFFFIVDKRQGKFSPAFFAYRAEKALRLHFSNGEAAASGLVDPGDGHKGLGVDLCDQIVELV